MATHTAQKVVPAPRLRTPHGFDQATKLVTEVGDHELAIRTNNAEYADLIKVHQDEIDRLNAERVEINAPHAAFINKALPALNRWYVRNLRRYGRGRQIELPTGIILRDLDKQWTVETSGDPTDIISAVRRRGLRFVTIKVTLNKTAIAGSRGRFRKVQGLRIFRRDRFEVIPNLLLGSEAPKENRLRVPVETIENA